MSMYLSTYSESSRSRNSLTHGERDTEREKQKGRERENSCKCLLYTHFTMCPEVHTYTQIQRIDPLTALCLSYMPSKCKWLHIHTQRKLNYRHKLAHTCSENWRPQSHMRDSCQLASSFSWVLASTLETLMARLKKEQCLIARCGCAKC